MHLAIFALGFASGICSVLTWALCVEASRDEAARNRKPTNLDKLKKMDAGEMAVYVMCPYGGDEDDCKDFSGGGTCNNCTAEWLMKEAGEEWEK